jgi:hypothetical protein
MNRIPERRRPLVVLAASLAVLLVVAGGVLVIGRLTPTPTPTTLPTSSASTTPSADPATPEGAVRAFFAAYSQARRTDDPGLLRPFVTSETSDAYRSVKGFLDGQRAVGKASITTVERIENVTVQVDGSRATVTFTYTEGGYDIDLNTGQPLESPVIVPAQRVTVELEQRNGSWLVDRYESGG